jgi:arylsulfatase A-like enzyme
VVLLSDHGEAFGEHNVARHGTAYHQEQLHVPLVFRGPGIPDDETIDAPVSLVDVAPTILGLLGLPPLPAAMGIDLSGAINGARLDPKRPIFFSWLGGAEPLGVRLGSVKLIQQSGQYALLDLENDPDEVAPRRPTPEELTGLAMPLIQHRDAAAAVRAATAAPSTGNSPASIPPRVEESLRALGYL